MDGLPSGIPKKLSVILLDKMIRYYPTILIFVLCLLSCSKVDNFEDHFRDLENKVHTGLPIVSVNTPNGEPILSKDEYVKNATFTSWGGVFTSYFDECISIKGRGNSTWKLDKKPYRLKFEEKVSFFGRRESKDWVLLANHYDNTLLRTTIVQYLSDLFCHFDFTPHSESCELILNDSLCGNYLFCEQVKISKGRVLNGEDGYLLEIDDYGPSEAERGEAVIFYTPRVRNPFNIKGIKVNGVEDVCIDDENYQFISHFICNFEEVLFDDGIWLDPIYGYKNYIDLQSFVDWYLINEISKNADAVFISSCYMNYKIGGKLKMGPLWDFDLSFGNKNHPTWAPSMNHYSGFFVRYASWYSRLFDDSEFVCEVIQQYSEIYSSKQMILKKIDEFALKQEQSAILNCKIWETFCNKDADEQTIKERYYQEILELKTWLSNRMDWLKNEFENYKY